MNDLGAIIASIVLCLVAFALGLWAAYRILRRSEDPIKLVVKFVCSLLIIPVFLLALKSGPFAPLIMATGCLILGVVWAPDIGALVASPISNLFDGGSEEVTPQPFYSVAEGKRRRGDFDGAIEAIQNELIKFPNDFTGQMMLATIYVEHLNRLDQAEMAVRETLSVQERSPAQISDALTRLADWHLRAGHHAAAADAFQQIINRLPETNFSHQALQRLAHLMPAPQMEERQHPKSILLKPGHKEAGLSLEPMADVRPKELDPETEAGELALHLEMHPMDVNARERLAKLYGEHYRDVELARSEIELLMSLPNRPPKDAARWLNTLADLQIRVTHDFEGARATLNRIIQMFPHVAVAEHARTRLAYLQMEIKGMDTPADVKMGKYERDLGLENRGARQAEDAARPYRKMQGEPEA